MPTRLIVDATQRAAALRSSLRDDFRRLREDAGLTRAAVARVAGLHPSAITRLEAGDYDPTLEVYMRISAALGADFVAKPYPTTGSPIRDRHQVRMAHALLAVLHPRWQALPEVAVRRPARGWVDVALADTRSPTVVATELESMLRRIEQTIRWSADKAASLQSASEWENWTRHEAREVSRLLVVRSTRLNRDAAESARRTLREAYPADPRDALEALMGAAAWPGPTMLWARIDRGRLELSPAP